MEVACLYLTTSGALVISFSKSDLKDFVMFFIVLHEICQPRAPESYLHSLSHQNIEKTILLGIISKVWIFTSVDKG